MWFFIVNTLNLCGCNSRGVFRTRWNLYDGVFLQKKLRYPWLTWALSRILVVPILLRAATVEVLSVRRNFWELWKCLEGVCNWNNTAFYYRTLLIWRLVSSKLNGLPVLIISPIDGSVPIHIMHQYLNSWKSFSQHDFLRVFRTIMICPV